MKYLIFAVIGAILTVQSAVAADKKLTISVYSFAQDAYKKALYDPFEAICDCKLVIETGNSVERMAKIEANAANPVIDMAVISSHDALALARKGLLQNLDVSKLSSYDDLYEAAKNPWGKLGSRLHLLRQFHCLSLRLGSNQQLEGSLVP